MWAKIAVLLVVSCVVLGSKVENDEDKLLAVEGPIIRTPEDGVLKLYEPESLRELKCKNTDGESIISDTQWYIIDEDGEEEDLMVNSDSLDVSRFVDAEEDTKPSLFKCRIGEDHFAEFRVHAKKPDIKKFKVKKFKRSYELELQMDEEFTCEVINKTMPLEDLMKQIKIRWYKWKNEEDLSFYLRDDEGQVVQQNCTQESQHPNWVEITGDEIEEGDLEPHIQIFEKQHVMKIEDARFSDRRGYKCIAFNVSDVKKCSESSFFIRVKDKYAALWPFIGIVAEVVILVAIIIFCEKKKKAAKDVSEDDEEYNGNAVSQSANSSGVRQRRS